MIERERKGVREKKIDDQKWPPVKAEMASSYGRNDLNLQQKLPQVIGEEMASGYSRKGLRLKNKWPQVTAEMASGYLEPQSALIS